MVFIDLVDRLTNQVAKARRAQSFVGTIETIQAAYLVAFVVHAASGLGLVRAEGLQHRLNVALGINFFDHECSP